MCLFLSICFTFSDLLAISFERGGGGGGGDREEFPLCYFSSKKIPNIATFVFPPVYQDQVLLHNLFDCKQDTPQIQEICLPFFIQRYECKYSARAIFLKIQGVKPIFISIAFSVMHIYNVI